MPVAMSMSDRKLAALIYLFCTAVYAATAGPRLRQPSTDTHFVYQAQSWLKKRLDLGRTPPHQNDWAEVETLKLADGNELTGHFLRGQPGRFRTLKGELRPTSDAEIASRSRKYYVSFPPFPALAMLPAVAIFGPRTNDVLFNVLLAGAVPAILYLLLRRQQVGLERGSALWLTGLFAFGSVFYFSSVIGQVWFTAHIVSLLLCALYLLCALPPRWPILAGLLIGALYLTRPQMAAIGLLYLFGLWQRANSDEKPGRWPVKEALLYLLPCALLFALGGLHNHVRFGRLFEFGHSYLTTMQADNIQRFGLMNYQYLPRNLAAALCLLPKLLPAPPYLQVSYHGLALWFTTPALFYALWPEKAALDPPRRGLAAILAACIAPTALAGLLYQNDGYIQFGYRFSLDFMLPAMLILSICRPAAIKTWPFRLLVLWGVIVNLLGAITFGRAWQFYFNGFFPVT
jgi:hypothetical protein